MPLALALAVQAVVVLHGTVQDPAGLPIAHALVYVADTQLSAETDQAGRFELAIESDQAGSVTAFRAGFSPASLPFDLAAVKESDSLAFTLVPARIAESVIVTAPALPLRPTSSFALRPLDAVRTPGSMGDLMRALQTLPGVAQAGEGAGLYVRGGDTSEVLVVLDDAVVFHPYRQETPAGGFFGSVEPFLLEGVSVSTGAFSAKYGNALSAVLDLHGLRRPESAQTTVTIGLAGASLRAARPIGANGGVRVSGNRSFPALLFAVNGRPYEFDPLPGGWDLNGSAHYTSPAVGSLKLFAMSSGDHVGVGINSLSFGGVLRQATASTTTSLHWERVLAQQWLLTATGGATRYERGTDVGVLDLTTTDLRVSWRTTMERGLRRWTLRFGGDGIAARTNLDGTVPSHGGDLGGTAGSRALRVRSSDDIVGAFIEGERRVGRLTATLGARADRFHLAGETTTDPRVAVKFETAPRQQVTVAWGEYHQAPDTIYDPYVGALRLSPMRAQHFVAGYERGAETDLPHVRAEVYEKRYEGLPIESPSNVFTSRGYGFARGLDAFAHVKRAVLDLTADYSYVKAERRWTAFEDRGKYAVLPAGTWRPTFDIPHTAHVIARVDLTGKLQTALGWRISSGVLDTPVSGATPSPSGYIPIYGPINAERLPRYERVDVTMNYLTRTFGSTSAILFASVGNAFARRNIFQYAYSPDFSARRPVTSATPRVVYFGMTITR